ncbi:hypothetical protein MG293_000760 [Ovis ammon polii]|uniref:Uncharacterized protein n=1 Tax=Ovis ammon polii TaxID=230172 RepID=A0AAD4UQA3_OVIAM|nr:hypothetical protein MG293_000760 [Ovis ammon polii]
MRRAVVAETILKLEEDAIKRWHTDVPIELENEERSYLVFKYGFYLPALISPGNVGDANSQALPQTQKIREFEKRVSISRGQNVFLLDIVVGQSLWTIAFTKSILHIGDIIIGEGNGIHSSTLAWKIPWMEEPGYLRLRMWKSYLMVCYCIHPSKSEFSDVMFVEASHGESFYITEIGAKDLSVAQYDDQTDLAHDGCNHVDQERGPEVMSIKNLAHNETAVFTYIIYLAKALEQGDFGLPFESGEFDNN